MKRSAAVTDVLEGFRAELERQDLSPATVRNYVNDVELFARWYSESYDEEFEPGRIVQREVAEYRSCLQGQGAAAATINRRLATLRRFFEWAGSRENPAVAVRGIRMVDPGVQALSTPQLRRLMREVHARRVVRDIALLEVLAGTAIRVGELVALRVQDVEISERKGVLKVRNGKGRSARDVPMNVDVRKALSAWLEARAELEGSEDLPGEGWLFLGQRGRLRAAGVWRIVRRYGDYAGIPDLRVHQLRHTALTRLVRERGVDLATVARISGHQDVRTLMRYAEPTQDDLAEAVEGLALGGELD